MQAYSQGRATIADRYPPTICDTLATHRRLADAEGGQAAKGCCGGGGGGGGAGFTAAAAAEQRLSERVAALAAEVAGLEARVEAARRRALRQPLGTAYFALFSSARVRNGRRAGGAGQERAAKCRAL